MFSARMHPRFEMVLSCSIEEVQQRIRNKLAQTQGPCIGTLLRRHVMLKIRESDRHFWSPVLNIDLDEVEAGTRLKGSFGPHPNVWGMFVVFYSLLGLCGTLGLMLGFSQFLVNETPTGLLIIPLALLLAAGIYIGALFGQRLATEQMEIMRHFFDDSVCDTPVSLSFLKTEAEKI